MKIGYVRVSTEGQNTARQELLMSELGVEQIFIDKASGKSTDRPQLKEMLAFARKGDQVVVESISRFARNTKDLLELMEVLQQKEIGFVSKKEAIDTTTPTGRFMLTVFAAVAELEREYLLQRQREGIEIAKREGKYKGRKPIRPEGYEAVLARWRAGQMTAGQAMQEIGVSRSTFYTHNYEGPGRQLLTSPEPDAEEISLVNIREGGSYIQPRTERHASRIIHYQLGFPEYNFHSLRHTHATMLAERGALPKDIQNRLGHKNIGVTMQIYVHLTREMEDVSIGILEDMPIPDDASDT